MAVRLPIRSFGDELFRFDEYGLVRRHVASINDLGIDESARLLHQPPGLRPDGHAGLSELGV